MTPRLQEAERSLVSEQAAKWLTILSQGDAKERAVFVTWLKQSPRNIEEFLFASATLQAFAGGRSGGDAEIERIVSQARSTAPASNVVSWSKPGIAAAPRRSRTLWRWTAAAAAAGIILFTSIWISRAGTYETDVGEQRTVRLADGSLVFLNAQSRLEVEYSQTARDLELSQGEATFKVARDAGRPFRVHTGDAVVQAIGTQFNVYRQAEETLVSVLEGQVRVSSGGSGSTNLTAGEEARVATTGKVVKRVEPDVAAAVAWRERRLVFRADRLEDIAADFARYSPHRIELKDKEGRNRRITGTFDADDPASLVQFLQELDDLTVDRNGADFIVSGR